MKVVQKPCIDGLRPCRHCGRLPKLQRIESLFEVPYAVYYQVTCKCGIRTKLYKTKSGAIKCWSREVQ